MKIPVTGLIQETGNERARPSPTLRPCKSTKGNDPDRQIGGGGQSGRGIETTTHLWQQRLGLGWRVFIGAEWLRLKNKQYRCRYGETIGMKG